MSIHASLRGTNTLIGERSVFTRKERMLKLMEEGKMTEDDSPHGLPKVRTKFKIKTKKKDEGEEESTE
jgi:small basic protein (TIGR04137 family)